MDENKLDQMWLNVLHNSNEMQRRQIAALKALELGWGGVSKVCHISGMSHNTVDKGIRELKQGKIIQQNRIRKAGGGRKKIAVKNPTVQKHIENILDENTAGDPMSKLKWTNKSTYVIAKELISKGEQISEDTVQRIIRSLGYTLQANVKSKENRSPEERDSQFRYINKQVKLFEKKGMPVISVDTKKRELVGNFKNNGRKWQKKGKAEIVNIYDFENMAKGKAIPYGIYEIFKNNGFVNVGISHNTSEFAVESIRKWWKNIGKRNYSNANELMICADSGGSNANRSMLWKYYLQKFANEAGLKIAVCHYPPGTSKWNKIEHKMFSFISMNWRGKPLTSYELIINLGDCKRASPKIFSVKNHYEMNFHLDKSVLSAQIGELYFLNSSHNDCFCVRGR